MKKINLINITYIVLILVLAFAIQFTFAQDSRKVIQRQEAKKTDNYTVQYLIVFNERKEILLQKNNAGWHTLAMRSTESQSIKEAMDSLAKSAGLTIHSLKLAGLYTYKFEGLPDHRQVSFRTHYTAELNSGNLIKSAGSDREYHWVPVKEAMDKLTFESLKLETSQILKYPEKIWGGTFLIIWKDDKFVGSRVLEEPYPLSD